MKGFARRGTSTPSRLRGPCARDSRLAPHTSTAAGRSVAPSGREHVHRQHSSRSLPLPSALARASCGLRLPREPRNSAGIEFEFVNVLNLWGFETICAHLADLTELPVTTRFPESGAAGVWRRSCSVREPLCRWPVKRKEVGALEAPQLACHLSATGVLGAAAPPGPLGAAMRVQGAVSPPCSFLAGLSCCSSPSKRWPPLLLLSFGCSPGTGFF